MSESKKDKSAQSTLALASRRRFFKSLGLIPVISVMPSIAAEQLSPPEQYQPTFFTPDEWAFVLAACDRLIPNDDVGPGALAAGVPQFLDRHMQTPYANGAIWYRQGPFREADPEFGYQGRLVLNEIIRLGIKSLNQYCRQQYSGSHFAELDISQQNNVLQSAEKGKIELQDIDSKLFFSRFLAEVKHGFFSDPSHGGNRNMVGWKMIGYPGVRADYADWVTVRDKPYPLPPVDLAGKRG